MNRGGGYSVSEFSEWRDALLASDPELRAEYEALGPEYEKIQKKFDKRARKCRGMSGEREKRKTAG